MLRELRGVLENGSAQMGELIVLHDLGETKRRKFKRFMGEAGDMHHMGRKYPRLQLLTVADILEGRRFDTPGAVGRQHGQTKMQFQE